MKEDATMVTGVCPPGSKGHFLLGNMPEFWRDPLAFVMRCARDHGDIAGLRLAHVPAFLLTQPDYVEEALRTQHRGFIKGRIYRANRLLLGNGMLASDGEFWLRRCRSASPPTIAQRFQLKRVPGHSLTPLASLTLRPKAGVRVVLARRSPRAAAAPAAEQALPRVPEATP
jgi:cytochrome P450